MIPMHLENLKPLPAADEIIDKCISAASETRLPSG
jgi:hypothetical protein